MSDKDERFILELFPALHKQLEGLQTEMHGELNDIKHHIKRLEPYIATQRVRQRTSQDSNPPSICSRSGSIA